MEEKERILKAIDDFIMWLQDKKAEIAQLERIAERAEGRKKAEKPEERLQYSASAEDIQVAISIVKKSES